MIARGAARRPRRGALARRLVLEERQRLPDGAGGSRGEWVALGTIWAEMRPATGADHRLGGDPGARLRWFIRTRAAPEGSPRRPRPGQRLREGARAYEVLTVSELDPRGLWLGITASEEVLR
ncbi:MAG: head-tail adaptor protein [Alphaproteobacteria bacterium]|nr:MAG: head-tail adaptor protein [Alphaproteobacteria bacterium]